jgi:hypothetical protein
VWRLSARLLGEVDHARLASLEVYAPASSSGCFYGIFVSYPGSSYLFCHERSLLAASELDHPTFALKLSEKGFEQLSERGFGLTLRPSSAVSEPYEAALWTRPRLFRQFQDEVRRITLPRTPVNEPSRMHWASSGGTMAAQEGRSS